MRASGTSSKNSVHRGSPQGDGYRQESQRMEKEMPGFNDKVGTVPGPFLQGVSPDAKKGKSASLTC